MAKAKPAPRTKTVKLFCTYCGAKMVGFTDKHSRYDRHTGKQIPSYKCPKYDETQEAIEKYYKDLGDYQKAIELRMRWRGKDNSVFSLFRDLGPAPEVPENPTAPEGFNGHAIFEGHANKHDFIYEFKGNDETGS
jgi:hypothetical protein